MILPLKSLQPFPNGNNNNNNNKKAFNLVLFYLPLRFVPNFLLCDHQLLPIELCILETNSNTDSSHKKAPPKLYWTSMEMWKSIQLGIIIFHNPLQIIMLPQKNVCCHNPLY